MNQISCEACKSAPVETTVDSDDPQAPFRVCSQCAHRLEMRSLRPVEWYNLAAVHGPYQYLLHDDFYDDDGTACQPEEEVADAELFPAPSLEVVSGDIELLVEYSLTRLYLSKPTVEALSRHSKQSVLVALQNRLAKSRCTDLKILAYEVCAEVLNEAAEEWIRREWKSFSPSHLISLAAASAACLPRQEGYDLVVKAIATSPSKELVREAAALSWFRSEATLIWIEENISDQPLVEHWGRLAAVSNLTWEKVANWLAAGRPLSLVALDALNACWHYNTLLLKRFTPVLLNPASINEMNIALDEYLDRDSAPRVRKAINAIRGNWDSILKSPNG